MKSVFIAGSRKFFDEIENTVSFLKADGIDVKTAGKWDKTKEDTPESEKEALLRAFKEIDKSDVLFVFSEDGYIGKTVAMEIGYAYSKGKEIISSSKIDDFSAQGLVSKVMGTKKLLDFVKG